MSRRGDSIFCMGNHRSYQRIKRDAGLLVPEGLAAETAVFARLMNVSLTTLTTTNRSTRRRRLSSPAWALSGILPHKNFTNAGYDVTACEPVDTRRDVRYRMRSQKCPVRCSGG